MVRFGARFVSETQTKKHAERYVAYEELKVLLTAASRLGEGSKSVVGARHFEHGLLGAMRSGLCDQGSVWVFVGVSETEAEQLLECLWSRNWTRLLSWQQQSYAGALQAFDVALACEYDKVAQHYQGELDMLEESWAHHLAEEWPRSSSVEEASLKRSLCRRYYDGDELRDFGGWNAWALRKITKKRDKIFWREPPLKDPVCASVEVVELRESARVSTAQRAIVGEYAALFCEGDVLEAQNELKAYGKSVAAEGYSSEAVRLGYRSGVAAVLAVWVLWDCIEVVGGMSMESVASKPAWPVFRACGELVAWHWMWGLCLEVWAKHRVNVDFLFDSEPSPNAYEVYDEAAVETIVLLALLLVYYKATYKDGLPACVTAYLDPKLLAAYAPAVAACFAGYRLCVPWARRKHLWHSLSRVVAAPCVEVKFVDTYVADVLGSMVKIWLDALWAVCFFGTGDFVLSWNKRKETSLLPQCAESIVYERLLAPVVCLLPVWFRFAQCLRKHRDLGTDRSNKIHLLNATKYALSMLVSLSSALKIGVWSENFSALWLGIFCLSSFYSWAWDVVKDWGVRAWTDVRRGRRLYPADWWYQLAVLVDAGGRFVWLATLVPPWGFAKRLDDYVPEWLVQLLAITELARRCLWSLFRLEYEHCDNAFHNRPKGAPVPVHFKLPKPPQRPGSRIQTTLETAAVAALVLTLLVRIGVRGAPPRRRLHSLL